MPEYPIHKVSSDNLSQKVMMLERMLENKYPWKITVMVDLDGTGNLVATNLYLGICTIKSERR